MVLKPCGELIAPLQATIDAIPVPGLSMLFDLGSMLEEVVYSIQDNAVEALISGSLRDIKTAVDVASVEIGVAAVKL